MSTPQADGADKAQLASYAALGLTGKFVEVLERQLCEVSGEVPCWLAATLLRNGPGVFDIELEDGATYTVPHWFDGLGQLHEFTVADGQVQYRSRHLYPALEAHIRKYRRYRTFFGINRPPGSTKPVPLSPIDGTARNNLSVTIGQIANTLYSKSDSSDLAPIDLGTLAPQRHTSYKALVPELKGQISAAHGQRDEQRRTFYNFTLDFTPAAVYTVFGIPDDQPGGHVLARIRADPAYIHAFATTEKYVVLMVWPLVLSVSKMSTDGPGRAATWKPERGTMFYVVDKQPGGGGHVATYKSDAFLCFHTINAWEAEDGGLAIDLIAYDKGDSVHDFSLPYLRTKAAQLPSSEVRRYTLPNLQGAIAAGPAVVHAASRCDVATMGTPGGCWAYELPRICKAVAMRPYQFAYTVAASSSEAPIWDCVAKVDVGTGETLVWRQPGHFPGEPIFVPRPGGQAEDDGLLLAVVLSGPGKHSYLLMLDAATMQEVARASVPHPIAFGFHGNVFFPDGTSTDLA